MQPSEDVRKAESDRDPFAATHPSHERPGRRGALDDPRLHNRTVGSSLEDQEMAGRILVALSEDGRVDVGDGLNDRITIKSEDGVATVTGVVDCAADRMAVREVVESLPNVDTIQDSLTVAVDRYLDDGDLSRQVRDRLDSSGLSWVGFRLKKGIVNLVGRADSLADAERARRVAAGVKGIRDVVNGIKIQIPQFSDDIDIASQITQALSLKDLVVVDREVRVLNGVAEIAGRVRSVGERRRIHQMIGEIGGVRSIKDRLRVDPAVFRNVEARRQLGTGR